MKKLFSLAAFLFAFMAAYSQDIEMATGLRSSGKIYVVVLVIAVIFIGMIIYLFSIDKRVSKLEKKD